MAHQAITTNLEMIKRRVPHNNFKDKRVGRQLALQVNSIYDAYLIYVSTKKELSFINRRGVKISCSAKVHSNCVQKIPRIC